MVLVDVQTDIVIDCARDVVARYAADPDNVPQWYVNIKSVEWETVSDSATRMSLRNRGRPSGFSAIMAPSMSSMVRRANRKDLALLKQILEDDLLNESARE